MGRVRFFVAAIFSVTPLAAPSYASVVELSPPTNRPPATIHPLPQQSTERELTKSLNAPALTVAGVDYCYAGSVVDPDSGARAELFVTCPGDGVEQNLDLA